QLYWTHRQDGLVVFGCPDAFEVFDLPRQVPPLAVVADSFHVKPLLRLARTPDRYQILCLTRNHVQLFEGDRDGLNQIDLEGGPATVEEGLGEDVSAPQHRDNFRGSFGPVGGGKMASSREPGIRPPADKGPPGGHPAKGDDSKLDGERFFTVVDRAV